MPNITIFVVNLRHRADRLAHITKQLESFNLSFERIEAVNGSKVSDAEQNALFDKARFIIEQKKKVVSGEIGCAMSHRLIWQKIIDNKISHALILEDDVTIDKRLISFLQSENYKIFDVLNLSTTTPYPLTGLTELIKQNVLERPALWHPRKQWGKLEWRRRWRIFRLKKATDNLLTCECDPAPALASGYIISNHGAKSLLVTSQRMFFPIDYTWRYAGGLLHQGFVNEPLVTQTLEDSDICGREIPLKLSLSQKVQRFFFKNRRLRRRLDVVRLYGLHKL